MSRKWLLCLRLAWRNVLRHTRRTAVNLFAIALGCAALVLISGFIHNSVVQYQEAIIRKWTGHLQLARAGFWDEGITHPERYLIENYPNLARRLSRLPQVRTVLPRLTVAGVMSNGMVSVPVLGQGSLVREEAEFIAAIPRADSREYMRTYFQSGDNLSADEPEGVLLAAGLARALNVKVGDRVTLLANTLQGTINGLDLRVRGIILLNMLVYDNVFFRISLDQASRLLNTDKVQTVVVGLDSTENLPAFQAELMRFLASYDQKLEARTWDELFPMLTSITDWMQAMFRVVRIIILLIVGLSILNTISQSIQERIGEIGTVLALGTYRRELVAQFLIEGGILGILGSALGCAGSFLLTHTILAGGIPMPPPPGGSLKVLIYIDLLPGEIVLVGGLSIATALLACLIPAWRASRLPIVEALRSNV